jgi:hypothetical protein
MKTIKQFILESNSKMPHLNDIYNVIDGDSFDYKGVIDDIVEYTFDDKDKLQLKSSDIKKIFKGYEKCTFYGTTISDEENNETSEAFFTAHGDGSGYDHIMDWSDNYEVGHGVQILRYEDTKNNILLIWSGYDLERIYLAKK